MNLIVTIWKTSFFVNQDYKLIILHQNIAGIINKLELIEEALINFENTGMEIDVLCITETFLNNHDKNLVKLQNYKLAVSFCRDTERRGGTCILIKNNIKFIPLNIVKSLSCAKVFECCGIELLNYKIVIVCIYRIPNLNNINDFFVRLQQLLDLLINKKKSKVILCGDWNIDTLKDNNCAKELRYILMNYNLISHITVPTRKKACLDLIISNIPDGVGKIHHIALSDHETGQTFTITSNKIKYKTCWYEYKRDFSQENIQKFINCISSLTFNDVNEIKECEEAFQKFHSTIILFFKLCFPVCRIKISNRKQKVQWITRGIKRSCCVKRKLYLTYIKSNSNKKHNKLKYEKYKNTLKLCLLKAKSIHNTKHIKNSKNKCKACWDVIKKAAIEKKEKINIDNLNLNGEIYKNPKTIVNLFNTYFTDFNITNATSTTNYKIGHDIRNNSDSIYLVPTDAYEVSKIIKSLKNTNAVGYDEISTKLLKLCAPYISNVLSYIINLSFEQGYFPKNLKLSIIKPIFKSGDASQISNYRPITLIPILAKVFERAMYTRVYNFLTKYNILKPEQFGFRKGSSTTQACFSLIKQITDNLNNKHKIVSVFLDLTKAFDFVDHDILLQKLERYGIRGVAYDWFYSYLYGRKQCTELVKYNNTKKEIFRSEWNIVKKGVPQGSILGPLSFLVQINDLPNATNHNCILFADDTTVVIGHDTETSFENEIHNTILNMGNWFKKNKLTLNINKTKMVQFRTRNSRDKQLRINYDQVPIESVNVVKFLGILIDSNLDWKNQADKVCKKLHRFVFALRRIRQTVSLEASVCAYHGYVSSVLSYGVILWGNSTNASKVFVSQKKCVRALVNAHPLDSCKPIFKKLKLLPLPCIYIKEICIFVKRNLHYFVTYKEKYGQNCRQPNKLIFPKIRLALFSKNVYCMSIKIYNRLPNFLLELNYKQFKYKITNWLIEKQFYSITDYLNTK